MLLSAAAVGDRLGRRRALPTDLDFVTLGSAAALPAATATQVGLVRTLLSRLANS
jgi:hypothetical protein